MLQKWIAMLLCLAMVLSLCACGEKTPSEPTEPTQPTETTTESTAPPVPTAEEVFHTAKDALLALDQVTLLIEAEDTRTVAGESYTAKENMTARYAGLQGDLLASLSAAAVFSDEETSTEITYTEKFVGDTAYSTFDKGKFREEIGAEDYLARQIPLCLFEAENFGKAELSEDGSALTFSEATALESWVAPDYAELVSAEATAQLKDGTLSAMTYTATFRRGAADVTVNYDVTVNTASTTPLTVEAPADADTYVPVDNVAIPRLMMQAAFNLTSVSSRSTEIMQVLTSVAAGYVAQMSQTITEYGTGEDYKAKQVTNITEVTQEGQQTFKLEETFSDGTYTYAPEGQEPEEYAFDAEEFAESLSYEVEEYLMEFDWITSMTLTNMGDGLFMEFTSENEECRDFFKEMTMYEIFRDDTTLEDMASSYECKVLSGYMGIDMDTLMPTSYSIDYQGEHTIQGGTYLLGQQITCAYTAPNGEAYKEITGEALPETEPDEKASPLFYRVTGANGEEMWLLGTIHIGDQRTGFLPQEVYDAFDASDALAVEFDMNAATNAMEEDPDFAQKIATLMVYTDGTTAQDHMDAELYEEALRHMQYTGNYSSGVSEVMKVSMWENFLSNFPLEGHRSLSADKGMDQRLLDRAEAAGKEILNVESMESQLKMLMGFSDGLQEYLLKATMATPRHEYIAGVEELYELWCSGDEAALRDMINEEETEVEPEEAELAKEYEEAMSTNRDKAMVETAKGYLDSGKTVFYAVGLAHLLKDNGLVDSLRAAGYTVELVSYAG